MQGLGGLLCLATVAIEALLSVMAAALSGFGLFFRVSFRWGHDDLLRIVMSSIPTYMKETMSHLASISRRQTRGEDAPAPPSYKPFMMNGVHGVSSENPHQCLLKFMFGKARKETSALRVVCSVFGLAYRVRKCVRKSATRSWLRGLTKVSRCRDRGGCCVDIPDSFCSISACHDYQRV